MLIKGEDVKSIAISESDGVYLQVDNISSYGPIELELKNVEKKLACIKLMAKISKNGIYEYLLYDTYVINEDIISNDTAQEKPQTRRRRRRRVHPIDPSPDKNTIYNTTGNNEKDKDNKTDVDLIIIIAGWSVFGLIAILLLVIICFSYFKNQNLMNKVTGISFSEGNQKDNLLTGEYNNKLY